MYKYVQTALNYFNFHKLIYKYVHTVLNYFNLQQGLKIFGWFGLMVWFGLVWSGSALSERKRNYNI